MHTNIEEIFKKDPALQIYIEKLKSQGFVIDSVMVDEDKKTKQVKASVFYHRD